MFRSEMKKSSYIFLLLLAFLVFDRVSPAFAHPADVYTHNIHLDISTDALAIKWEIKPGPLLIQALWFDADVDQDGLVSREEANAWAASRISKFSASLDGRNLPLQVDEVEFPATIDSFQAGLEFITISLSAPIVDAADPYRLTLQNGVEEQKSLNWYYINATDDIQFEAPKQNNSRLTFQVFSSSTQADLLTSWDSSMPSLSSWQGGTAPSTPEPAAPTPEQQANLERLLDLVRAQDPSLSFYIFALVIALALGALHALTPGHGKTVVAAYLVGSRGTIWHAVVLGTVVTLTHTGSVFLLGVVTLAASQYILPTTIIPWLEVLSGVLILGLGLYLLWQRFQYWLRARVTSPVAVSSGAGNRKYSLTPSAAPRKISGSVKVEHLAADAHHHGDGVVHSHAVPEALTWRSLIALGVSGGLVPCPDAIAILLVAVAINRILLGLALIVSFSFGLALILIVIGLLMVSSRRLFDRFSFLDRVAPVMPIVSALIVLVLGIALTWGAFVRTQANAGVEEAADGGVSEARVLYQMENEERVRGLYLANVSDGQSTQLTDDSVNVTDFALSPDGTQLIYIVQTDELENQIWLMNVDGNESKKIHDCKNASCAQPVWSPDGSRVIFEHIKLSGADATGLATLWWIDINTNKVEPLFQEDKLPGANPRWSADGEWLSYATSENLRLYHFESGESREITSSLGASAAWSPDGGSVLYRDVIIHNDQFVSQLFVYDLESQTSTNIRPDAGFENFLAAWSPDGKQIAVVRRDLSVARGDQIWLMDADGGNAHALTDAPNALHGTLSWSADGQYILYDLYDLDTIPLIAKLQIVNVESAEIMDLNITGYNPRWLWP
jgi:nickel/cobalt exporter